MKKLNDIFKYAMIFLLGLLVFIGNLKNGITLTVIAIVCIYFFVKKIKIKKFGIFLILFSLISKIAAIIILKTPIIADSWIIWEASQNMLNHDYSFLDKQYFMLWGYQLFHVFYEYLVLSIYNDVLVLKILNCVYSTVITYLIYKIVKELSNEDSARITSLIYAVAIYPIYLNSVLLNHQLSLMFTMIGIYILLCKKDNKKNLIKIGILLSIANLDRPEGIVFIFSIILYFIFTKKNIKEILFKSFIILSTYLIICNTASLILIKTGFNEIGFGNNNVYWKFVEGFSYETNGKFNENETVDVSNKEATKKLAIERIKQVNKWPGLFYNKIKIFWLYDDLDQTLNVKAFDIFGNEIKDMIVNHIKVINVVVIFTAFIGLFKNKIRDKRYLYFIISLLVYFGVYLLIEIQLRYYYNPQVLMIILSSAGVEYLLSLTNRKKKNKKNL